MFTPFLNALTLAYPQKDVFVKRETTIVNTLYNIAGGCNLKNGAFKGYSRHRAETTALCPAQGIEAESPDDDRRE
ncbi:MAG: hypothetical protein LBH90_02330, partial [Tannerella sp.]|nr:hypothetical protein [Tannerella sp.]